MRERACPQAATSSLLPAQPPDRQKQPEQRAPEPPAFPAVSPARPFGDGNSRCLPRPSAPAQPKPQSKPDNCASKSTLPVTSFILRDAATLHLESRFCEAVSTFDTIQNV